MFNPHVTEALAEQRRQELRHPAAPERRFGRRSRRHGWVKRALRNIGS